ncbi:MAG: hypothetical protein B7C24_13510 [Bacteroidetes bacterium 4572_77]|nr:MAG: hypothetical protein B7C24_13510 [Bacteroidetes bacterium 4572_77]
MKKVILIVLFSILPTFLYAQVLTDANTSYKTYDLSTCLNIAIENNYDLQSSKAYIDASRAGLLRAFGSYLPSLNANMGYSRHLNTTDNDFTNSNPNSFNMGSSLGWEIFDGFGRESEYSIAQHNLRSSRFSYSNTIDFITYQVYANYINVIRNAQIVKIRRENIKSGEKELEMIRARFEAGIIPIANVYSQEADLGNRESALIQAENNFEISKATLLIIMGMDPTIPCHFPEASITNEVSAEEVGQFYLQAGSFQDATTKALEARNDYLAILEDVSSAEDNIKSANSLYSPTVNANLNWNWMNTELNNFQNNGNAYGGLTINIPIFNKFSVRSSVENAKLNLINKKVSKGKLELSIKQNLQTAFLRLKSAEKMLDVTKKTQKFAEQNQLSVKELFKLGAANITDLSVANMQFLTAKINRVDAVYGYIAAQKEVLYHMGELRK